MTHPGFLDQPFIKVPNPHPDESLDFRVGEVVYSNPKAIEWNRLSQLSVFNFWLYTGCFTPILSMYKTHIPSNAMLEGTYASYMEYSMMMIDVFGFSVWTYPAGIAVYGYLLSRLTSQMMKPFVSKLQFNRTKDLLFITYTGEMGYQHEEVVEMANLEHMTPGAKSSNLGYSFADKGGFMILRDLAKNKEYYGRI